MSFLTRNLKLLNLGRILLPKPCLIESAACLHITSTLDKHWNTRIDGPQKFLRYNKTIFPPQTPDEKPRPAYVCYQKLNIKYSPKKMYWVSAMVRGLTVDEALRQLSMCSKKGATFAHDAILEAQQKAIEQHNVEFRSNLWVAESMSTKGIVIKGIRRHAKKRVGHVEYKYSHYFVRLEEGKPPADYYMRDKSYEQLLNNWIESNRKRKIISSL